MRNGVPIIDFISCQVVSSWYCGKELYYCCSKLEVKLQGNVLDPVLNAALKSITKLFRTRITNAVEQQTSIKVQKFLDKINQKIPRPDVKESNNIFNYLPASYELPAVAEAK